MSIFPVNLKTEWLSNPIGIGEIIPVLSWQVHSTGPGAITTAWQVLVSSSEKDLHADRGDLWDSGKIAESRVNQVLYRGSPPASRQRCGWKVRVWDRQNNPSEWSEPSFWEMGLLHRREWLGTWIGSSIVGGPSTGAPAPYLRKPFSLGVPVRSARLYATALGLYECEINGQRVGGHVFTPGWTDYRKRVCYQVYDVTSFLKKGANVLGAILGDGWHSGYVAWHPRQYYGDRPKFLAQLEILLGDDSRMVIPTDSTWKTTLGPILGNDLLMGEAYDARLELGPWSLSSYDDCSWSSVHVFEDPSIEINASPSLPVQRAGVLPGVLIRSSNGNKRLYDFSQNFSGRVRLSLRGARNAHLTIRHGERLDEGKDLYTQNLRKALATDYYTLKGEGVETFEPRFTFHGFQYVEVGWQRGDVEIERVEGIVLQSETPPTGRFSCSNALLNQLQHNIEWGQKSNFLEVPTDCPQRDERLGWTGDAQVFVRTACFNADVRNFFHKWMRDARDAQFENGAVPCVIPNANVLSGDGGPAWSDATVICPWTIYLCYGDVRILENHYASMQRYVDHLAQNSRGLIRSHPEGEAWKGFGDWLALDGGKSVEGLTPKDLIGTAFFAYDAALLEKISHVLGKAEEEKKYRQLHEDIAAAFRSRFITPEGLIAGATQTSYVLALHFGLLPKECRGSAARELACSIRKNDMHLATGFVGTPYLCQVLEDHGYLDLAYQLLEQETFPSWLFPVKNGATTIWERWDGWTPEKGFQDVGMNSFNHYAYGAIGAWMVGTVAGLELDPEEPGYRHIIFRPRPGGSITWAEAALETPLGRASIHWELKNSHLHLNLSVPVNARATVSLPEGFIPDNFKELELAQGNHHLMARKSFNTISKSS